MSTVGKILIGLQLALSVVFMAIAGAVYSAHTNWKTKHDTVQKSLQAEQSSRTQAQQNAEQEKATLTTQFNSERDQRLRVETELATAQTSIAALTRDKNDLQAQIQTQTGLAETKANEAGYRDEEARKQRTINSDLQARLDETVLRNREMEDTLFSLNRQLADLQVRHDELLEAREFLKRVVAQHNLSTNPREVAALQSPPPVVDGVVQEVRMDRTNRPHMVLISIGSDDGLVKGHRLEVFRTSRDGRDGRYLGRIRVLSTQQNEAVCEVIDAVKNGIIEVGDNVTTKLL
ncbi:MAG: hypothetical protein KF774_12705 [Planctomyces sp.]|nr:hypothetical protein [Planctomyces sp.]